MGDQFKTCPDCGSIVGDWRAECDCGHVFNRKRVVRRKPTAQQARARQRREQTLLEEARELAVERNAAAAQAAARRDATERGRAARSSGCLIGTLIALGVTLASLVLILLLVGIASYPLQVIAFCLVLIVLFGVGGTVVVIVRRNQR